MSHGAASLLALGVCAVAAPVMAQERLPPPVAVPPVTAPPMIMAAPPRPSVITSPRWVRQPMAEFPERAQARGIEYGRVRLECVVSIESRLTDCQVLLEDPAGAGFAQAALAGVPTAIVEPRVVDGVRTPARVTFNVDFKLEDPPPPEPAPQPLQPQPPRPAPQPTRPAPAPTPESDDRFYASSGRALETRPQWERRPAPTPQDFPQSLVDRPTMLHVAAIVSCRAEAEGALSGCHATYEFPSGSGVGDAARLVAQRGRLVGPIAPDAAGRQPTVSITIIFKTAG